MTTIKILTTNHIIPVEIGKLKFEFDTSDESVLKFKVMAEFLQKEIDGVNAGEDLEKAKGIAKQGLDLILGDGAFDKIYKQTPSLPLVMKYFQQLSEGIGEEVSKLRTVLDVSAG